KFVDKNIRVYYDASVDSVVLGRTARERQDAEKVFRPDSVVLFHVASVNYPLVSGNQTFDAVVHGEYPKTPPTNIDLRQTTRVETLQFSRGRTLLVLSPVLMYLLIGYAYTHGD